jgi:alkanesulfonate monooxygenase SsuD/methylene tetrahydromethanopterin reductase-like flavin-dependent oxidoreductase (luciferase family)
MQLGLFCPTFHPPTRSVAAATDWDLEILRWADTLGFAEAWLGEHYTLGWEPLATPDLLIAMALAQTTQIRLGPAAHLLPYHHPVELAARIAWLDQLAQGRYVVAFGAGSYASDQQLFATGGAQANRAMADEAQEVLIGLWRAWSLGEPFRHAGEHYQVDSPAFDPGIAGPHLRPWRGERPEIAIVGASPGSASLRRAGAEGFIPMTVVHSRDYAATHWDVYAAGAAAAGRAVDRSVWRVSHPVFVADTDAEARARSLGGAMGATYREWILPHADRMGTLPHFAPALAATGPVTVERLADGWLMGSPDTVTEGILALAEEIGGFGTLLVTVYDYADDPGAYRRSLELLATEVLPRVNARLGSPVSAALSG